jgi:hypothetical protein
MNAHRAVSVALAVTALGFAVLATGCDQSSGGAAPSATTSAAPPPPVPSVSAAAVPSASSAAPHAAGPPPGRHHVGIAGLLLRTAYDQNLSDDERAPLDKAEGQLYPDGAPSPWTAAQAFHQDLVAGIRANKIDTTKVTADYAAFDKAIAAGQAAEADALNTLHGAMPAADRQGLVDRVKAKLDAREHAFKPATGPDGGAPDWNARRLDRLTAELALDDGQKKAVAAVYAKDTTMTAAAMQARHDTIQKRIDAVLADFPKDSFDAKKADLSAPPGKTPHDLMERQTTLATALLGILKGDQVTKYADRVDRMGRLPSRYLVDVENGPPLPGGDDMPMMMPGMLR